MIIGIKKNMIICDVINVVITITDKLPFLHNHISQGLNIYVFVCVPVLCLYTIQPWFINLDYMHTVQLHLNTLR